MQKVKVQSLVRELRSHMPCGQKYQNIKQKQYLTNSIKTLKKKKAIKIWHKGPQELHSFPQLVPYSFQAVRIMNPQDVLSYV